MRENIAVYVKTLRITIRPNSDLGLWMKFLLPAAIIVSSFNHPIVLTPTYKLAAVFCLGLSFSSLNFIYQCNKRNLKIIGLWSILSSLGTGAVVHLLLGRGLTFSFVSGIFSNIFYLKLYIYTLKAFPNCFTLGEASVVVQGICLLLYTTVLNVDSFIRRKNQSVVQISTLIIQLGLLGLGVICYITNKLHIQNAKTFYLNVLAVITVVIIIPLHVLLDRSPVLWIFSLMFDDVAGIKLMIYWSSCVAVAVLATTKQIVRAQKASTGVRKVFHALAVVVFIPGLIYKCSFLYLATGVILGIFIALEILRILNLPPLGIYLQDGFAVFSDEKDAGILALTPIYLLGGCSIPLWIHPAPCDITDSAIFSLVPLLSGLLATGVGDSAASIVGSNFGKHHWPGSKKTIEGTLACVLSQFVLIFALIYFGWIYNLTVVKYGKIFTAVILGSIVEANTTQVDNLVLPLIMYIILI